MEGWDNKDTESQGTYLIRQRMQTGKRVRHGDESYERGLYTW